MDRREFLGGLAAGTVSVGVELMVGAISSGNYLDAGIDQPAP